MTCMYCKRAGTPLTPNDEEFVVCEIHAKVLAIPELAERFLKGYLTREMKGQMDQVALDSKLNQFIEVIREMARTRKSGH